MKFISPWTLCPPPLQEYLAHHFDWHNAFNILRFMEPSGQLKWIKDVDRHVLERCKVVGWHQAFLEHRFDNLEDLLVGNHAENAHEMSNSRLETRMWSYSASITSKQHLILHPPRWIRSHRFARKFGPDRFISIQNPSGLSRLELAGRSFRYLTNNDGEAILFAELGNDLTPFSTQHVLDWHIPIHQNLNVPFSKYTSRISLALSPTIPTISIDKVEKLPDIMGSDWKKHVMTDGCGMISWSAMKDVATSMGLDSIPTAVQARFGSNKGVWHIASPQDDGKGHWIGIRPSQTKYVLPRPDLEQVTLEVNRVSTPSKPGNLNGQYLAVLESGGVPSDTLVGMFSEWLTTIRKGLQQDALRTVQTMSRTGAQPSLELLRLLESGFTYSNPRVSSLLTSLHLSWLKAQLMKPMMALSRSATLLCIPDPSGKLKPGQVYLNPSHANKIITGSVLCGRTPCLLPWDIQKLQAVDVPDLHHLKDVVVFSIQGTKPTVQTLSGGDYDGDLIWCCWDPRLFTFKNTKENQMAVDGYFERNQTSLNAIVSSQKDGLWLALVNHQKTEHNNRTLLAKYHALHLKTADLYGYHHVQTIRLGMMLARLVDATKHGWTLLKATLTRDFGKDTMPFPHYAMKPPSRKSTRARGRVYDMILQNIAIMETKSPVRSVQTMLEKPELDKDLTVEEDVKEIQPIVQQFVKRYQSNLSQHIRTKTSPLELNNKTRDEWKEFKERIVSEYNVSPDVVLSTAFKLCHESNPNSAFLWNICVDDLCDMKKRATLK